LVVFRSLSEIHGISDSVLTLGTFDGIHLGHQKILKELICSARENNTSSCMITFVPHPQHILKKSFESAKVMLTSEKHKIKILEEFGLDMLLLLPFDKQISMITADMFLKNIIIEKFKPVKIVLGYDHHFGYQRQGNSTFLQNNSSRFDYELKVVNMVTLDDMVVSSSNIRDLIYRYEIRLANRFLGRPLEISGRIVQGNQIGNKLTFPTANIIPDDSTQILPPVGVYCVSVLVENQENIGMCYIGTRPTFTESSDISFEVNIFNFDKINLYGKEVSVRFNKFVRPEMKFESAEMLINQLKKDKEMCLSTLDKEKR